VKSRVFRESAGVALAVWWALATGAPAAAQSLPSDPIVVGDGRLTIGGDISATFGCAHANNSNADCADDAGFFNYTDYEHSALRAMRVDLTAALRATNHISLLGEIRSENASRPEPYALYVRIRPWAARSFDIQVGRVPPVFGAFARRTYAADNLLIGYPLAYQYLTSLRPDSLPASPEELIKMRGRGWLSSFSIGSSVPDRGVPLVSAFRWDTGVEVHTSNQFVDATAAVTNGTVADPLVSDNNGGKQIAGRVAFRPFAGLIVGASAARGQFPSDKALSSAGVQDKGRYTQIAWGGDIEYSQAYYLVRFEAIGSDWRMPVVGSPDSVWPLRALATSVEGRYKIRPGLYAAARVDHLGFSQISTATLRTAWEAPVTRLEIGGGYLIQRNLELKLSVQHNTREVGRVTRLNALSAQIVYWF
jgi:hypothetical protein